MNDNEPVLKAGSGQNHGAYHSSTDAKNIRQRSLYYPVSDVFSM